MTISQIIACTISSAAAIVAIAALIRVRKARRECAAKYHLQWSHGGGTFSAGPLTEAEFDALVARLQRQFKEEPGA